MNVDARRIALLQGYRKKRNTSDYERAGGVSQQEANEIVRLAKDLRKDLMAWLAANHPDLIIGGKQDT